MTNARTGTEVTSGAPDARRLDTGRFRVSDAWFPPGHLMGSHYHERAVISVVVEGRFLQSFPGRECDCPPGGLVIKPPGERHVDRWFDAPSRHLIVEPHPGRHGELDQSGLLEETYYAVDPAAEGLARRILRELGSEEPARELAIEALTLELMVRIRRGPAERRARGAPPLWLVRVRELLEDRFRDDLSLDDLAAVAGVHRSHLSRSFGEHFNVGLAEYVRALRIEAARSELAETDDPISRIALRNGFADQSHLTRALKRAVGLTPARYRRTYRR